MNNNIKNENASDKYIIDTSNNQQEDSMGIIIEMGVDPYASSSQSRNTTPERLPTLRNNKISINEFDSDEEKKKNKKKCLNLRCFCYYFYCIFFFFLVCFGLYYAYINDYLSYRYKVN